MKRGVERRSGEHDWLHAPRLSPIPSAPQSVGHGTSRLEWKPFFARCSSIPLRHVVVFLIGTVALVIQEVDFTEGWHLVHILELLGVMGCMYSLWAA